MPDRPTYTGGIRDCDVCHKATAVYCCVPRPYRIEGPHVYICESCPRPPGVGVTVEVHRLR